MTGQSDSLYAYPEVVLQEIPYQECNDHRNLQWSAETGNCVEGLLGQQTLKHKMGNYVLKSGKSLPGVKFHCLSPVLLEGHVAVPDIRINRARYLTVTSIGTMITQA